uniref:Uncharacterized protein n=1 Tax=Rhizophora mucronata TaxID=61149 RepID=A0A2P2KPU1_RHIMU
MDQYSLYEICVSKGDAVWILQLSGFQGRLHKSPQSFPPAQQNTKIRN